MQIEFKTNKLKKRLTDPRELVKALGQRARKVNQRMEELKAAENLAVLGKIPAARCHELTGDHKGELALDISKNYRLVLEAYHNPLPQKADSGLDWERVTVIRILRIEDYH